MNVYYGSKPVLEFFVDSDFAWGLDFVDSDFVGYDSDFVWGLDCDSDFVWID